jgi:DNA-binding SARP family transcriptional activator
MCTGKTWLDCEAAIASLDSAEGAVRPGHQPKQFGPAWVAATITERPFLPDIDVEWARLERDRLKRVRVRALECLAQVWIACDDFSLAIEAATEALRIEPCRESAYRLVMQAHSLAGNAAQGVLAYHELRERLVSQLGTDPSPETERLYLALLR